jgi:hypothetical protein
MELIETEIFEIVQMYDNCTWVASLLCNKVSHPSYAIYKQLLKTIQQIYEFSLASISRRDIFFKISNCIYCCFFFFPSGIRGAVIKHQHLEDSLFSPTTLEGETWQFSTWIKETVSPEVYALYTVGPPAHKLVINLELIYLPHGTQ